MNIEWRNDRLYLNGWDAGWVNQDGRGWYAACQFTRSVNHLPCEDEIYASKEEAMQALEEQALVMFIGMREDDLIFYSHRGYEHDTVCKTE